MLLTVALGTVLTAPAPPQTDPVKWTIDPVHSEISFKVRHFVSKVPGIFTRWTGEIVVDPAKLNGGSVAVTIQTASINTSNDRRDGDLRSPNFFAADSFPTITFKSTKVEATGSALKITGDLTMRGVTKPVVLSGEFGGTFGPAVAGKQKIGFSASAKINRLDYGVKWNRLIEGTNMLGDDVEITINIEATRA